MQYSDRLMIQRLRLLGFESRTVPTSAGRMHALDAPGSGSLPPVLLLHGFSAAAHLYEGVLTRIRPHVRRVVAIDLLGHGESEMPATGLDHDGLGRGLLEAADVLLDGPTVVFGNSLGGAAAIRLAASRPERVHGLFLVAPGGAFMESDRLRTFVAQFGLHTHADALRFVDRLFRQRHPLRHVLAWGTRQRFARPGLGHLLERLRPEDLLRPEELRALEVPTHVVWGGADRILGPEALAFYRSNLPRHASLEVVEAYGHAPHVDHPDSLHTRLLSFVDSLGRAAHSGPALRPVLSKETASRAA